MDWPREIELNRPNRGHVFSVVDVGASRSKPQISRFSALIIQHQTTVELQEIGGIRAHCNLFCKGILGAEYITSPERSEHDRIDGRNPSLRGREDYVEPRISVNRVGSFRRISEVIHDECEDEKQPYGDESSPPFVGDFQQEQPMKRLFLSFAPPTDFAQRPDFRPATEEFTKSVQPRQNR